MISGGLATSRVCALATAVSLVMSTAACAPTPAIETSSPEAGAAPESARTSKRAPWPEDPLQGATPIDARPGEVAVIIAIEDYDTLNDVPGARKNAIAWHEYFKVIRGIPSERVLVVKPKEAESNAIRREIEHAKDLSRPGEIAWFVFIGHGAPIRSGDTVEPSIIPVSTRNNQQSMETNAIPQSWIAATLGERGAQPVLIVDACFSGRDHNGEPLDSKQPTVPVEIKREGPLALTAASGSEYAGPLPGGDRPAFSYLLLGALAGWAADPKTGKVTGAEAVDYARTVLAETLPNTESQTPEIAGDPALARLTLAGTQRIPGPDVDSIHKCVYFEDCPGQPRGVISADRGGDDRAARVRVGAGSALIVAGAGAGIPLIAQGVANLAWVDENRDTGEETTDRLQRVYDSGAAMLVVGMTALATLAVTGAVLIAKGKKSSRRR